MKAILRSGFLALAIMAQAVPANSGPLEDGKAALDQYDYATAILLFRKAAGQGNADAQAQLGTMYNIGLGAPQSYTEAAKWYRKAAEQGYAGGQFNLGNMYRSGRGVPQDDAEAVKWYRKAAEQGESTAQGNLGNMYTEGRGVGQDLVQAHMWFTLAMQVNKQAQESRDIVAEHMSGRP